MEVQAPLETKPMCKFFLVPAVGLLAALVVSPRAASQPSSEWKDLLGRNLKDWTRIGNGKNPWQLTADRTLVCGPANDAYAPDNEFYDGTLKFEYRFRPAAGKTGYKAALSARWSQNSAGCKIALGDDCGTITGTFVASSDATKELEIKPREKHGRVPGEWNLVKVQMDGRSVTVNINGKAVGSWERCPENHGLVLFEAEGSEVEFRQIHWKEGK